MTNIDERCEECRSHIISDEDWLFCPYCGTSQWKEELTEEAVLLTVGLENDLYSWTGPNLCILTYTMS